MSIKCILTGGSASPAMSENNELTVAGWTGSTSPFTQVLTFSSLRADTDGILGIAQTADVDARSAARDAMLEITGQGDGYLEITCDADEAPTVAIPVTLILLN